MHNATTRIESGSLTQFGGITYQSTATTRGTPWDVIRGTASHMEEVFLIGVYEQPIVSIVLTMLAYIKYKKVADRALIWAFCVHVEHFIS